MIRVINLKNITKSSPPTTNPQIKQEKNTNKQSNKTNKHKKAKKPPNKQTNNFKKTKQKQPQTNKQPIKKQRRIQTIMKFNCKSFL